jgi:outer membrane protein assembly factor BamB
LPAGERIARLAKSAGPAESAVASAGPDDFALPTQSDPSWQFSFLSKVDPQNPQQQPFNLVDQYGRPRGNDFPIPSAIDDKRVYVNVFGVEMAFDLVSGKLVWRVGKLHTLQLQQSRGGAAPELYSIRVFGDRTLSVSREVQQNNANATFALIAREAATGKEIYSTRRTLSSWNIQGQPWLDGELIYVGGTRSNQARELSLLVINAKDGKLVKNVVIGTHAADPNQHYGERVAEPSMLVHRDRVFLDTHAGALVCLQRHSGNLDWGLLYESPAPMQGYYYNYAPPSFVTSGPLRAGGLVFNKGMRSSRLVGIDTDGPTMVWNRPIDKLASIVGADENCLYTSGEELAAFSLKTQELLWATPLPRSASWSQPIITRSRLYQFTSRGICEVDKQTGDVVRIFRGADLDSFGGGLLVSPHTLVTISNLAISAYPRTSGSATTATP